MAKTTKQWGTWVPGPEPVEVGQMVQLCLDGMKHGLYKEEIQKDKFGAIHFEVTYRWIPPCGPEYPAYLPDGVSSSGFSSVKITYEVEEQDEREEESSRAA